jgi:phosphatidate phosphatase APP1
MILLHQDIDDTIKITMTHDGIGILKTTFVDEPEPVARMPDLYRYINSTLSPTWFYLTASPYNLYPFLHGFCNEYYPSGTIILRDASWMNIGGFISSLTVDTQSYKEDRLTKIHSWLPQRKVLAIGDSTQRDPEAYGTL